MCYTNDLFKIMEASLHAYCVILTLLSGAEIWSLALTQLEKLLMSSMAWVRRCYSKKSKNLNKLLAFEALYL